MAEVVWSEPALSPGDLDPRAVGEFTDAAIEWCEAAIWKIWHGDLAMRLVFGGPGIDVGPQDLSVLGNAGEVLGLALYPEGSVETLPYARKQDFLKLETWGIFFQEEPRDSGEALLDAGLLPFALTPLPFRRARHRPAPTRTPDLCALTALLRATAQLRPDRLSMRGEYVLEGRRFTAEVSAPAPEI